MNIPLAVYNVEIWNYVGELTMKVPYTQTSTEGI